MVFDGFEEGWVGGGEGDDGVGGVGEAEDGGADAGDDAGEEAGEVALREVGYTGVFEFFAEEAEEFGVAFDVVVAEGLCEAILEGGADGGGDGEVHVGDPEWEDVGGVFRPLEVVRVAEGGDVEFEVGAVHRKTL